MLAELLSKGIQPVHVVKRARILELLDIGLSPNKAGVPIGVTPETARRIGQRYNKGGLWQELCTTSRVRARSSFLIRSREPG